MKHVSLLALLRRPLLPLLSLLALPLAALLLVAPGLDLRWGFAAIALTMALGALLDADRVAETLGKQVTDMSPGQGFAANLATAGLVVRRASTACR